MKKIFFSLFIIIYLFSCTSKNTEIIWENGLIGNRAPDSIRYYFNSQKDTITTLYKNRLYQNPELQGNFVLHFYIRSSGKIENISIDSTSITDNILLSQIRLAVSNWTFPVSDIDSVEVFAPMFLLKEEWLLIIEHLHLRNFRNYFTENIDFTPGINLFIGPNGSGKSNLLEAIHYISLGRPIRSSKEFDLINFASTYFFLSLRFKKKDILTTLSIYFSKEQKTYKKNDFQLKNKSDLVGKLMAIPFSPEDADVIRGGPSQRRRAINILLCSLDISYLENLRNFKKSIRQRNALLMRIRKREDTKEHLSYWDSLIDYYSKPIIKRRKDIIEKINSFCLKTIKELNFPYKDLRITYKQACESNMKDAL